MSVRALDDAVEHIAVRGTMVSTCPLRPSPLHVRCLENWGMPNVHGRAQCDGNVLNVSFDRRNENLIHVWAAPAPSDSSPSLPLSCAIS
jgi:hypothetical protein